MKSLKVFFLASVAAAGVSCLGAGSGEVLTFSGSGLAIVNSNYSDTTVSIIDRNTREVAVPEIVTSAGGGLSQLLSGDVILPSNPSPDGTILLLDRGNHNVTLVDPATAGLTAQWSLKSQVGDLPNPYDAYWLDASTLLVSRYGWSPSPSEAFSLTRSNDLVTLDLADGQITELPQFDFNSLSAILGDHAARPSAIVPVGPYLAVTLAHLHENFGSGGPGLLAIVNPATLALVDATPSTPGTTDVIVLQDGTDVCRGPGGAAYLASAESLYVACSGVIHIGSAEGAYEEQLSGSRVMRVNLAPLFAGVPGDATVESLLDVSDLYPGADTPEQSSLSGAIQIVSGSLGFAVTWGSFGCDTDPCPLDSTAPPSDLPSALFTFNSTTGAVYSTPLFETEPFLLGGISADPATDTLYLTDAKSTQPRVRLFDYTPSADGGAAGAAQEDGDAAVLPNGRPGQIPRELAPY